MAPHQTDNPELPDHETAEKSLAEDRPDAQVDPSTAEQRVEAVLFLARQPLNSRKISQLAGLEDGTQARTIIRELNSRYDRVGRAFHIKRLAGGFQMLTRPQFSQWIRRLDHVPGSSRLSTPAMETLTVVAYRQPIIKAEIEAIRGVSCGEMLRQLLEKGLVKIAGRSQELGRPYLYGTSKKFLTRYGFNSLNNLPHAKKMRGEGLPVEDSSDHTLTSSTTLASNQLSTNVPDTDPKENQS